MTAVVLLGLVLSIVTLWLTGGRGSVLTGPQIPAGWLLAALIAITCCAEITVVRLRHADAVEELTLYEAALIINILLLPPDQALLASTVGLLAASLIQRRPLTKALFNLGTYAAAVSALIAVVHAVGGASDTLNARVLAGVLAGSLAFTAVNLGCLAQIIAVINHTSPWRVMRREARLSLYMAVGTTATGLTMVVVGANSPLLLPITVMPALAVTYAYRSAAQEAEANARSATLSQLSQILAERDDLVRRFLLLVREVFDADLATLVHSDGEIAWTTDVEHPNELREGPVPAHLARLRDVDGAVHLSAGLPTRLRDLVVAPVGTGDRRFGILALAVRAPHRGRLSANDLTLLAPLVNALAAAMSEAAQLSRLADETSKLQAVVEQSAEGIVMLDNAGSVRMWNRACADLTGISGDEADGQQFVDLLMVPSADERASLVPVTPDRSKAKIEVTVQRRDGELRHLRLAHSAIFNSDELVRDVIVVSDLTSEQRAKRLKSDFIAMVSHELRTPLTPILGYVDLLRKRIEQMTPAKRDQVLDLIADRAAHLSRLMEDLLLASRVGGGTDSGFEQPTLRLSRASHDLRAIVQQVTKFLNSERIVTDVPAEALRAFCDADRAVQVITNLVGNALKYSPDPLTVRVGMRLDSGRARVEVADQGRGIPADQVDKIFEKFHRVEDPMTMSTSGTGLGLFIARQLARAMDGDITVESTLNVGSVFTLDLPAGEGHDSAHPNSHSLAARR